MKRGIDLTAWVCVEDDEPIPKKPLVVSVSSVCVPTPSHHHGFHPDLLSPHSEDTDACDPYPCEDAQLSAADYYSTFIDRTKEQCEAESQAPQRSKEWKEARKFALTGSDFGSAAGLNPFCSPEELAKKKLWDTFKGNQATKWGSCMEDSAAEAFEEWARTTLDPQCKLHHFGLLKFKETPWLAVSPDGILEWTNNGTLQYDLVEFKCPTRTETEAHPYSKYCADTPPYYKAQMLGIWGYCNSHGFQYPLTDAWFVVWQPKTVWITRHSFTVQEWNDLFDKLKLWFFSKWLPALVWKYEGRLDEGHIQPTTKPLCLA